MEEFGAVGKSPWGPTCGLGQGQTLTELWWAGAAECDLGPRGGQLSRLNGSVEDMTLGSQLGLELVLEVTGLGRESVA